MFESLSVSTSTWDDEGHLVPVVTSAPEFSLITAVLLCDIAIDRGVGASVVTTDGVTVLTIGTSGQGLGVVQYRIGLYDFDHHAYPMARLS